MALSAGDGHLFPRKGRLWLIASLKLVFTTCGIVLLSSLLIVIVIASVVVSIAAIVEIAAAAAAVTSTHALPSPLQEMHWLAYNFYQYLPRPMLITFLPLLPVY